MRGTAVGESPLPQTTATSTMMLHQLVSAGTLLVVVVALCSTPLAHAQLFLSDDQVDACGSCVLTEGCQYCLDDMQETEANNVNATTTATDDLLDAWNDWAASSLLSYSCVCDDGGSSATTTTCITTTEVCEADPIGDSLGALFGFAAWIFFLIFGCCCLCIVGGIIGCICCCCPPEQRQRPGQHGAYVQGGGAAVVQQQQPVVVATAATAKPTATVVATAAPPQQQEPPMAVATVLADPEIPAQTGLSK